MKRPIVIAGGGLAGLSLGIALRRREIPVVLHEAGSYPRHRVCGEYISGVSDAVLDELGIRVHLSDAERLETARWSDGAGLLSEMTVSARGISRWRLDQRLATDFVQSGGELKLASRVDGGTGIVSAAGRRRRASRWVGLKVHVNGLAMASDLEMFAGSNGYVGLARIEDGKVNVCGLFRADERGGGKSVDLLLSTLARGGLLLLAERLRRADLDAASFCSVAGFEPGTQGAADFAIGDAAQMIPPFTGNGMSMAFESAALAIEPLVEFASDRISWDEAALACSHRQKKRFRRRMWIACGLHGFLTTRWGSRVASACARGGLLPYHQLLALVR